MSVICRSIFTNIKNRPNIYRGYSKITFADNGSTIIAFHPEKKFPYELTRPLPEEPIIEDNSVLKMNNANDVMKVFRDVNPEVARENLMKLTLTTKHRWYPNSRKLKKTVRIPMEKPFL